MKTVPLGEVAEFLDHMRKPVKASDRVSGAYPYYGANGQQGTINDYIFDEPLLLLAEDGGHFDDPARGIAYRISGKSWVNNHAHVLRMKPNLDLGHAYHVLRNMDVGKYITGTTRAKLTKSGAGNIEIPLPPLDEQRRIAAILDQGDKLRASNDELIAMLGSLAQSIFLEMFGDPEAALASGQVKRLGEIADLQGGRNIVAQDADAPSKYRVLKISSVTSGEFKQTETKPLPLDYEPPVDHLVRQGDLLISRANTTELVGAVAHVPDPPVNLALPDKIWRFVWHDADSNPLYYWSLFRSDSVRRSVSRLSSGTGGSMKNISKAKLLELRVPEVSTALQHEFARRLAAIPRSSTSLFNELLASLQSRAFSGQL